MKGAAILLLLLFVSSNLLFAQKPAVVWQKTLGGYNGDYAHSICATADGGFIVAGEVESGGGDIMGFHGETVGINDCWVVKLNSEGGIEWQRSLGGIYSELNGDIKQTADGGYILVCSAASTGCDVSGNHNGLDYWVIKLSPKGDIVWQKSYGGYQNEYAYSIDIAAGGGYFIGGETESTDGDVTGNHGKRDCWVIKIDVNGTLLWQKCLGGSDDDECFSLKATSDGGCAIAGYTKSADGDVSGGHGNEDMWIAKLDNTGNPEWQKCMGGSNLDWATSIQVTTDGGYIVAGTARSSDGNITGNHTGLNVGFEDCVVVKLDKTGTVQWQQCYGGDDNDEANCIRLTPDGGYVIAGSAQSANGDLTCNGGGGVTDMWILKINSAGAREWQKSIGGSYFDEAFSIVALADGSFIAAGATCSKDVAGYHPSTNIGSCADYYIVKLSPPLAIEPAPQVNIKPALGSICAGGNAVFTASAIYAGTNPGYQWQKNGGPVGSNSPAYNAANLANGDVLTCYVTSGGGCETALRSAGSVTVKTSNTIIQPEITIAANNTVICGCTPVTCRATVKKANGLPIYQWMLNGIATGVNGDVYMNNSLKAGDEIKCIYSDSAGCVANGQVTSNVIKMTSSGGATPTVQISTPTTSVCAGVTVTFTAAATNSGSNPTYQWAVNGTHAGGNNSVFTTAALANGDVVSCTVTTDPLFACLAVTNVTSNNITMAITAPGQPLVSIKAATENICTGQPGNFSAIAGNAGANPAYQWQVNGANAGANSSSFTTTTLADGDKVTCNITVDPAFTCATATGATSNTIIMGVKAQAAPNAGITVKNNDVCAGTNMYFSVNTQNAGGSPNYDWMVNNVSINNHTSTFSGNTLSNGDVVTCMVTPSAGACSVTPVHANTIVAIINPAPVVTVLPADTIIAKGARITLRGTVTSTTSTYLPYRWQPVERIDNDAPGLVAQTVPLTETTIFTLSVTDDKGCSDSAQAIITVKNVQALVMPTAFTPNRDGVNDVFRIPAGVALTLKEFSIYNRWGAIVFTTADISKGWDGLYHGKKADAGTYVYFIKGTDDSGPVLLKGTVLLIK